MQWWCAQEQMLSDLSRVMQMGAGLELPDGSVLAQCSLPHGVQL